MPPLTTLDATRWPLVGREDEVAALRAVVRACSGGLVVEGVGGVGKTRLVRDALDADECVWITATASAAEVPFGAFAPLLVRAVSDTGELDASLVMRDTVASLASGRSPDHRRVVVVDDAHLLGAVGAALLHLAAQHDCICVIAIVRAGAPLPDAVAALTKDGLCARLPVEPLTPELVADVSSDVLGTYVEARSARRLWELSRGVPSRLAAILEAQPALNVGAPVPAGPWRLANDFVLAPSLVADATSALDQCAAQERDALAMLAFGAPLPLRVVADAPEAPAIESLLARRIVAVDGRDGGDGDHQLRVADPLVAEVVRRSTNPLAQRRIKARLVELTEAETDPATRVRATHWSLDIDSEVSDDALADAFACAELFGDWRSVERFASQLAARTPSHDVAVALISSYQRTARPDKSLELIPRAAEWPGDRLDELAFGEVDACAGALGDIDGARRALARWRDRIGDDVSFAEAHFATLLALRGAIDEAADIATGALAHPDLMIKMRALAPLSSALLMRGDTATVLRLTEELMTVDSDSLTYSDRGLYVGAPRVLALLMAGELDQADTLLQLATLTARAGDAKTKAARDLGTGRLRLLQGRPRAAVPLLREAAAEFLEGPDYGRAAWCFALIAEALALLGDLAGAERAVAAANATRDARFPVYDLDAQRALVWVAVARGEVSAARAALLACAAAASDAGMRPYQLMALHDAARLGANVTRELRAMTTQMDGAMPPLFAAHAAARHDAAALEAVSMDFERQGFVLFAAEAAAEASRVHARANASVAAVRAAERAEQLRARCDGAVTPALVTAHHVQLTGREREVALMAARGVSSRDIANALGLSTRTVDNNLGRVYAKLGVTSRAALAELLVSGGGS